MIALTVKFGRYDDRSDFQLKCENVQFLVFSLELSLCEVLALVSQSFTFRRQKTKLAFTDFD